MKTWQYILLALGGYLIYKEITDEKSPPGDTVPANTSTDYFPSLPIPIQATQPPNVQTVPSDETPPATIAPGEPSPVATPQGDAFHTGESERTIVARFYPEWRYIIFKLSDAEVHDLYVLLVDYGASVYNVPNTAEGTALKLRLNALGTKYGVVT